MELEILARLMNRLAVLQEEKKNLGSLATVGASQFPGYVNGFRDATKMVQDAIDENVNKMADDLQDSPAEDEDGKI